VLWRHIAQAAPSEQGLMKFGHGLGFYISKQIIEQHGGTIRAENLSSVGARFIIELPLGSSTETV
jgi:signal transduction histidine kinase